MKLTLIALKGECEWTQCFLRQYANHCLLYVDCCVSSVKKYRLGTSKCHDHDIFTLHQPIRLQHFERGNEKYSSVFGFQRLTR